MMGIDKKHKVKLSMEYGGRKYEYDVEITKNGNRHDEIKMALDRINSNMDKIINQDYPFGNHYRPV